MTRYDPFAYGEVHLDPKKQGGPPPNAEDLLFDPGEATKQAPPPDASWSLLSGEPSGLPAGSPDRSEAVAFGSEILGEDDADADPLYGDAMLGQPSPEQRAEPVDDAGPLSDLMAHDSAGEAPPFSMPKDEFVGRELIDCEVPSDRGPSGAAPVSTSVAMSGGGRESRPVRRQPMPMRSAQGSGNTERSAPIMPSRRRRSPLTAILPCALCVGGGTGASWFWVMQHNPVMAGILGVATAVGAMFTYLLLRG